MANPQTNQGYLGIDSNVLIAYLIPEHPDHEATRALIKENHAVNPTVIHETYHSCVFRLKRGPAVTASTLIDYMGVATCFPIDSETVKRGLKLAPSYSLGGRDALILASYLSSNRVRAFVTMDKSLLSLKEVTLGKKRLRIDKPDSI